jgi:hypothetical protein
MGFLQKLFGIKKAAEREEHAVLVYLDGIGLPDNVYQECDTSTLEDMISPILESKGLGEFDGTETGPKETTLFLYGSDADRLFAGVEPVLRSYPLCKGACVILRYGGPGAPQNELKL